MLAVIIPILKIKITNGAGQGKTAVVKGQSPAAGTQSQEGGTVEIIVEENKIDKALEFLLTKNDTHPLLSVRAYEAKQFEKSDEFKKLTM